MRIIHCSDLHLDSKMTSNLNKDKARERKSELLNTYLRMIDFCRENFVSAVLIAGDMFDTKSISVKAKNTVRESIINNPEISFFYLKGNHDSSDEFVSSFEYIPDNLKLFSDEWRTYELAGGRIKISSVELSKKDPLALRMMPELDKGAFNIVMLHGQISGYASKEDAEIIDISSLRNKNIDYLALGHIHEYRMDELYPAGKYCYSGCLEGRGFDECGDHGFVLLDIDEKTASLKTEFVPFAYRRLYEIKADVSGCLTTMQLLEKIEASLSISSAKNIDLVKVVLRGELDVECEKNTDLISSRLMERYYFAKVYDETKLKLNPQDFALDASLKGEFVRAVLDANDIAEDFKTEIIRCGIQALNGEDIEL